ncbi:MAG: fimbrial biogenesis outer membrane usher protein, partial [Proteobacteria bacterium]|nr:fimbrial biogenesis outer membrane usher protein [Pseudomonadota bacterium]
MLSPLYCGSYAARAGEPEYAKTISNKLNTTGRTISMMVPMKDTGTPIGDIVVRIEPDDSVLVSKAELASLLKSSLDAAAMRRLEGLDAPQGFVSLPALRQAGLMMRFDPGLQELNFEVATQERQSSDISISPRHATSSSARLALPALFSGYVNVIAGVDYQWGSGPGVGASDGRASGRLELDSALRAWGLVLENKGLYEGDVDANVCPTAAHCVYDHMAGFKRQAS